MLVSAVQWSKSAVCIYAFSPSWISTPPDHHRAPGWIACAVQQLPTSYLIYTPSCIHVNAILSVGLTLSFPHWVHKPILYMCNKLFFQWQSFFDLLALPYPKFLINAQNFKYQECMHIDFEGQCFRNALLSFAKKKEKLPRHSWLQNRWILPQKELSLTQDQTLNFNGVAARPRLYHPHPWPHLQPRQWQVRFKQLSGFIEMEHRWGIPSKESQNRYGFWDCSILEWFAPGFPHSVG